MDFSHLGGLAFYQDTLAFIQNSYRSALAAVASSYGSRVIMYGAADLGASWSDGWVVIDGEMMPFTGGLKAPHIIVEEIADTEVYANDVQKTVYYTRRAKLGNTGGIPFTDFIRLTALATLSENLKALASTVAGLSLVPAGLIAMWSGAANAVPAGWGLCDGADGRPDLRGRFVVGFNSADADYNTIGKTGGAKEVLLTAAQSGLPAHSHSWSGSGTNNSGGGNGYTGGPVGSPFSVNTSTAGPQNASQSHENRPPYYTVAYIIKL